MAVNILCIGDVVGRAGRGVLADHLSSLIEERKIELVVCNAENAAGGSGLTPQIFDKLQKYGVDVVTLGDHAFRKREIIEMLQSSGRIIKPANHSPRSPGKTVAVVPTKSGNHEVGVVCVLGQMSMGNFDSPWYAIDKAIAALPSHVKMVVVDFHAEATSEKVAMGWHLAGRASVVFGTHTHVPTADCRVLDGGTAFISDCGMTGPYDSVLGRRKDRVLSFLTTGVPTQFEVARSDPRLCGIIASVDPTTGRARGIERIEIRGRTLEGGPYDADDGRPGGYRRKKK